MATYAPAPTAGTAAKPTMTAISHKRRVLPGAHGALRISALSVVEG
jgi:hypothetical protein